jgi:hypothetical protein
MEELAISASAIALPPSGPISFSLVLKNQKQESNKQNLNTHQIEHFE